MRVVIEVDIGLGRGGVEPGDAARPLAREASALEGVDFAGLMAWEGHLIRIADRAEKERSIHEALARLLDTKQADIRAILDSDQKIPGVQKIGDHYYNFWKDKQHERGLWRRTTLDEYRKPQPKWETVLDLDALNKAEGAK